MRTELGVPYGVLSHGAEVTLAAAIPGIRSAVRRGLREADVLFAVSQYTAGNVSRLTGRDVTFVGAGVDVDVFRPGPPPGNEVPIVGCVSRFVPRKGQHRLLRAVARMDRPVDVLLVGKGRTERRLRVLADRLGVRVRFAVDVAWNELPDLYRRMDVFCMPCRSRWFGLEAEGLGLVYLEAAACGLPVLAGDSGGSPETVRRASTGYVVHSVGDITEGLEIFRNDPGAGTGDGAGGPPELSSEVGATVVRESLSRRGTAVERLHYWRGYLVTYLSKTPVSLVPEESGSDPRPDRLRLLRPLIGHGADVAADVFMQRVPVEVFERYGPAGTADRAHNETWDRIVASGVVGLVAWVWLWSQILQYGLRAAGWRMRRRDRDRFTYASVGVAALVGIATLAWPGPFFFGVAFQTGFAAGVLLYLFIGARHSGGRRRSMEWGLLAALLSHLVEGTVGFGVTATRLLFWAFAALLVVAATERHETEPEECPRRLPRIVVAGLAAAIVAFVFLGKEPASPVPEDGPTLFVDLCRDTIAFTETMARRATWLFVGCAAGAVLLTVSLVDRRRAAGFVRRRTRLLLVLLVPVLAAVVAVVSVRPFRADILARSGMQWRSGAAKQLRDAGADPEPALRLGTAVLARASALTPRASKYRYQFAEAAAAAATSSRVRADATAVARPAFGASCEVAASDPATLFAHAIDRLEGARRWNRTSPLIPLNLAHVHSRWSRWTEESEVRQEQARAAALRMQQAREMYPPGIDLERWLEDGRSP